MSKRFQYYFTYRGKQYGPGTIIKLKSWRGKEEVIFRWYVPEKDWYVIDYKDKYGERRGTSIDGKELNEHFISIIGTDEYVARDHQMYMENWKLTFGRELQIDSMFFAWLWYIVLMAITFIFNGFYFYWIYLTVCFLIYRHSVLKKEGYK